MTSEHNIAELPLKEIFIDEEFNTRGRIDPASVMDLANDIERQGLIAPITVQPLNDPNRPQFKYRLLAGFRRSMAHRILKRDKILANIRTKEISEVDALFLNISENLIRQDLNIMQEAKALERLLKMGCTQKEMSERLGKSIGWIQPRLLLLELPEIIQVEVANGVLNQRHIRELHTHMRAGGTDRAIDAAKMIKQKVAAGKKNVSADAKRLDSKAHYKRGQRDVQVLQDYVYSKFGPCPLTVVLGWMVGTNHNEDLWEALEQYADQTGIADFKRPDYNLWNKEEALVWGDE